ncbi:MAG: hypothetical protein HN802_05100 [Candidatus Jacksonbacteria bacterium]|nr:hypothetical protein [Candidatus Jacksonbacteria bacterium]MBT7339045.1 hypothetical protein [Candidatus Jacksonbacteria bacterium]
MIDIINPMIKRFLPYAQEKMGFNEPPKLFLKGSAENAEDPLGKTAFYDPAAKAITVFITGRHPKDIMRSISHELVHHAQNCRGEFDSPGEMGAGYAQTNDHLRNMEREAYEKGNMCFRDWEDSIKSTIYFEHLQKGDSKTMSTKQWKNGELKTLLSEAWGLKIDLNKLNENNDLAAAHRTAGVALEESEELEEGDSGASTGDKGKDKDDPEAKDYTDGGDRKGDESKTHKGEKDDDHIDEASKTKSRKGNGRDEGGRRGKRGERNESVEARLQEIVKRAVLKLKENKNG